MFDRANGYDSQACVEEALRRQPDPSLLESAGAEFELGCRASDAAACSALGVLDELGLGRPRSQAAAHSHYDRACKAGNQRGCVNLGRLALAKSSPTAAERTFAQTLFKNACNAKEPSGCAELGRTLAKVEGADRDVVTADIMLDGACAKGIARSCYDLAELYHNGEHEDLRRSTELYVKACVAGYQPACVRLDADHRSVANR
jgi:hypothetical protein